MLPFSSLVRSAEFLHRLLQTALGRPGQVFPSACGHQQLPLLPELGVPGGWARHTHSRAGQMPTAYPLFVPGLDPSAGWGRAVPFPSTHLSAEKTGQRRVGREGPARLCLALPLRLGRVHGSFDSRHSASPAKCGGEPGMRASAGSRAARCGAEHIAPAAAYLTYPGPGAPACLVAGGPAAHDSAEIPARQVGAAAGCVFGWPGAGFADPGEGSVWAARSRGSGLAERKGTGEGWPGSDQGHRRALLRNKVEGTDARTTVGARCRVETSVLGWMDPNAKTPAQAKRCAARRP